MSDPYFRKYLKYKNKLETTLYGQTSYEAPQYGMDYKSAYQNAKTQYYQVKDSHAKQSSYAMPSFEQLQYGGTQLPVSPASATNVNPMLAGQTRVPVSPPPAPPAPLRQLTPTRTLSTASPTRDDLQAEIARRAAVPTEQRNVDTAKRTLETAETSRKHLDEKKQAADNRYQEEVKAAEKQISDARSQLETAQQALQEFEAKKEQQKRDIEAAQRKVKEAEDELKSLKEENQGEEAAVREKIQKAQDELTRARLGQKQSGGWFLGLF